jgi:DNA invertase Pin-like site-specific DNA recombinase
VTTLPGSKRILYIFWALAEFARNLNRERTHAGFAAAPARGRLGGWPKTLTNAKHLDLARRHYAIGRTDIATIRHLLGISRTTLCLAFKTTQS